MRIKILYFLFLTLFFLGLNSYSQSIILNEIVASNSAINTDNDGDSSDWIELYNPSSTTINLNGYGLSDDLNNPYRWILPNISIQANQYLLVWASGKDRNSPFAPLHTNFSISSGGEKIILTNPSGDLVDECPATPIPSDFSYGRKISDLNNWYFFNSPTPNNANTSESFEGLLEKPSVSHPGGLFSENLSVGLSTSNENAKIYYTLDGSEPNQNSTLYTSPIFIQNRTNTPNNLSLIPTNNNTDIGAPYYEGWQEPQGLVTKATIVRAKSYADGYLASNISTNSYLITPQGSEKYTMPVTFLNTNKNNFFDPEIGIYVPGNHENMYQRGEEWERPVHLELFETGSKLGFSSDMGVRTHGGTTRSRPRKSLRLYARSEYGNSIINYQLFPDKNITQYNRFLIRNSGNDWDKSLFRDSYMQTLAKKLNVDIQYSKPTILFLNGEYWGIHNIRDRHDDNYLLYHYGLEKDEIVAVENNSIYADGNEAGVAEYNQMLSFINNNNLQIQSNYEEVAKMLDPESFTDAHILNIFIRNTDWPGNNIKYWKRMGGFKPDETKGLDGRWRWFIHDTDFGFGLDFNYVPGVQEGPAHNTLVMATASNGSSWPNPSWSTLILRKLLQNSEYKKHFILRFSDLLNTEFESENTISKLNNFENEYSPEIEEHINRWRRPVNKNEWLSNIAIMRNFAEKRPNYVRTHLEEYFNLQKQNTITLQTANAIGGKIKINTITPNTNEPWSGLYFKEIPITLEAIPETGYEFSHWSGTKESTESLMSLTLDFDNSLVAHFKVSEIFKENLLNPVPYVLKNNDSYQFNFWGSNEAEGIFPANMLFLQTDKPDPTLTDEMTDRYHIPEGEYHNDDADKHGFPYSLTGRTRINGLGEHGISFINTGRNRDVGAVVLGLDTRDKQNIVASWTGGTIKPNARVYAIRMQYKIGINGLFKNILDIEGNPVEYVRNETENHEQVFGNIVLPKEAENQAYVQLRWKHYSTGTLLDLGNGKRDELRIDNIVVSAEDLLSTNDYYKNTLNTQLLNNYPNPAQIETSIVFQLKYEEKVYINIYDSTGRIIQTFNKIYPNGKHEIKLNTQNLQSGVYLYQMKTPTYTETKKMFIIH